MIGQTISHYKILEKLGEGGMGVVYKAQDTKLDRFVALKFLPSQLNASEQDKARFTQEAKSAAALNHPNVCSIIDIQEHDGTMFIVMEFVDGQTLRDKMKTAGSAIEGSTLPLKQAIDIGIQISDGLAAAHEKGIVHRDIKPENIMIRKDGIAQIMDFGLAKLRASGSKITRLTKEGSTVGTAGYMSPEQIQGQDTDPRSDIFSLGALLYELFTGELPFRGVHETALMYEIVNVDPAPLSAVKPEIDSSLDAIVLECLAKYPSERFQSVAEVGKELRRFKRESSRQKVSRITSARPAYVQSATIPVMAPTPAPVQIQQQTRLPWIVSGLLFLVAVASIIFHFLTPPSHVENRVTRSLILPPAKTNFNMQVGGHLAISPDGNSIAFVGTDSSGVDHVWVRPINSLTAISLSGTEGATYPFWSPDSRTIGFFAGGKLKKIEATGGPVLTICDASDGRGGTWNEAGIIVFSAGPSDPLSKVSSAGGIPARITVLDTSHHENSHRWPWFLPDGKHFLYTTQSQTTGGTDNDAIRISTIDSSMNKTLIPGNSNTCFVNGHILFIRQGTLMAQPFDPGKLEMTGDAIPIAEQIQYGAARSRGMFSSSLNGVLIFQSGENQTQRVAIFDRTGNRTHLVTDLNASNPKFSPDQSHIVYHIIDPQSRNADIWVHELSRGVSSRLTFNPAFEIQPFWSPHGDTVVFGSNRKGVYNLYIKSANGAGDEQLILESNRDKYVSDWSRDGRYLAFTTTGDPKTKADLWVLPFFGDRKPIPFVQTEFNEGNGSFSPDSRWIAYQSDESGRSEIYARLLDGSGGKFQISTNGGRKPFWKLDGRQLFFTSTDRKLQVAYIKENASSLFVDSVATLFDFESRGIIANNIDDVSNDGKQVLALVTDSKQTSTPITLVVNWDEELRKK
ncbi:MAG: protein kinase [Bacteroidota bacterium]